MADQVVHKCDFIEITTDGDNYYIQSFKAGFSLDQFNKIISQHPQIKITSFTTVKSAIVFAPKQKEKFGEKREKVVIEVSADGMRAFLTLHVTPDELTTTKRNVLKVLINEKLKQEGVVYGIKEDVLLGVLENEKKMIIAEGKQPENGTDCIIKMYEIKEAKPIVHADGSVDHYELNLINRVDKGEWLGERIDATPGNPGKTVMGAEVPPVPGKNISLTYDKNSVYEEVEGNKTVLYSKNSGAVNYKDGRISVSNHLEIDGDVDFSTGNIDFDGCVTIKGTIDDNFMVTADGDIEVLGDLGIGSIRGLESRKGSIYIKGGISSKHMVMIKAAKNVFAKYASNVGISAGGLIHIGFYCINCDISAREILIESSKGQIWGGTIIAEARISASTIGSPSEKRTLLCVKGIDKEIIKRQIEEVNSQLSSRKTDMEQYKNELSSLGSKSGNSREADLIRENIAKTNHEIKSLEEQKKSMGSLLKIHGDGEIVAQRRIFPNCSIEIKGCIKEIHQAENAVTYYVSENELKESR